MSTPSTPSAAASPSGSPSPGPRPDAAPSAVSLKIALVQVASSRDAAGNRDRLAWVAERAGDAGLVVLPEAYACDFGAPGEPVSGAAEDLDGPFVQALTSAAARQGGTWVAGMFERSADPDRPYNTLVVVDGDGLRASYRKIHLYDSFGFRESGVLAAGEREPRLVEVGGVQVGLMTCYDLRFPELARELVRRGAELLVVPAAWVRGPRKVHHWVTLATARAVENVAYVAAVCQPGPRYTGHSLLLDPWGETLAGEGPDDGDVVLTGDVDLAMLAQVRRENPSLDNRRDDQPWVAGGAAGERESGSGVAR